MKWDVKKYIHHREPFLFVDDVIELTEDNIVAKVLINEEWELFKGHFPEEKIFPGVLAVEALSQSACILAMSKLDAKDRISYNTILTNIDKASFHTMIRPGNMVLLEVSISKTRAQLMRFNCIAYKSEINMNNTIEKVIAAKAQITAILKLKS